MDQPEGEQRAISFMWLATTESFLCPKQMERNYAEAERGKEGPSSGLYLELGLVSASIL